jgi:hypothetical protein
VSRKLVHLGDAGRGVSRKLVHLGDAGQGGDGKDGLLPWLCALSERLSRVRVCCGDWARILTPSAMAKAVGGVRGVFLDPPYSSEAGRAMNCYGSHDDGAVAHRVREWAITAGPDPMMRIALCGYAGEGHEVLLEEHGWTCESWTARGGMQGGKERGGNRMRERIWFSPACLGRRIAGPLFAEAQP